MDLKRADESCLPAINIMVAGCIERMRAGGIEQWDEVYPTMDYFRRDCVEGNLLLLKDEQQGIIGCATLDDRQPAEYGAVGWKFCAEPIGVVHRVIIASSCWGRGLAKVLMIHVEEEARRRGFRGLRLDAFLENPAAMRLYAGLGYRRAGEVTFRKGRFACFEKRMDEQ